MPEKTALERLVESIERILSGNPYVTYSWSYLGLLFEDTTGQSIFEKLLAEKEINYIDSLDGAARMFFKEIKNA